MRLIIVRHTTTEEDKDVILKGWLPGKLSFEGKKQARTLATLLKNKTLDKIYTSDLQRCLETTKIISKYHKVPIIEEKLLRERCFGNLEGKKPTKEDLNLLDKLAYKPEGGENLFEVYLRAQKFFNKVKKDENKTILLVTHSTFSKILRGIILNKDIKEAIKIKTQKNTSIKQYYLGL